MVTGQRISLKLQNTKATPLWSSSDDQTAHMFLGAVTAYKAGNATVYATLDGVSYPCEIEIKPPVIKKDAITIKRGGTAKVGLKDTKLTDIEWYTRDASIATVDGMGIVHGHNPGSTDIYTFAGGVENKCSVTVVEGKKNR